MPSHLTSYSLVLLTRIIIIIISCDCFFMRDIAKHIGRLRRRVEVECM